MLVLVISDSFLYTKGVIFYTVHMKLEALFKSEKNTLFTIDGREISTENLAVFAADSLNEKAALPDAELCIVETPWAFVGKDEESYNEEGLASLRDWLKLLEENKKFAVIKPVSETGLDAAQKEALTASMKHCARRIKDCVSVAGFAIPAECSDDGSKSFFVEELSQKHAQYVYFSADAAVLAEEKIVRI